MIKTHTILIVDDDVNIRDMISDYFSFFNFNVIQAINGEDGLKQCEEHPVDVVITDIYMPGMDGFDCLMQLQEKLPKLLVYVITGGGNLGIGAIKQISEYFGAKKVFQKPLCMAELYRLIEKDLKHLNSGKHNTGLYTGPANNGLSDATHQ